MNKVLSTGGLYLEQSNTDADGHNDSGIELNVTVDGLKTTNSIGIRFDAHTTQQSTAARSGKPLPEQLIISIGMKVNRPIDTTTSELNANRLVTIYRSSTRPTRLESTCL